MSKRRWVWVAGILALAVVTSSGAALRRFRAAQFLQTLASGATAKPDSTKPLVETELTIPGPDNQPIRARIYRPTGVARAPGIVIAHGVHYRGIDEGRLVPFARAVAATGRVVLTPELRDLADYRITERGADVIATSVEWLSERSDLVTSPKVGMLGFSFAGGLSLVAAARPELEGRLESVTSVGGYHDLSRVLEFLLSDRIETPAGAITSKAHEYGLVVLLYQYLDAFVDEADRAVMGDALRLWLHEDRAAAIARASARSTLRGEQLFLLLETGRLKELRPELERELAERESTLRALSPRGRLKDVKVPVYLLHGSGDSVIPPSETDWGGVELAGRAHLALVSPLLEHVEVNGHAGLGEELKLVEFMAHVL
jgi:dienelactone hydrolase